MSQPIYQRTIWSELWARAQREPQGLYVRFTDGNFARDNLNQNRPSTAQNFTVARTVDPNVILILRPNILPPNQDLRRDQLRQILSDITVPDDPSIAPLE